MPKNTQPTHYEIDICYLDQFGEDFKNMKTTFEIVGFPNGNFEVKFEISEKTTKWMIEKYGADGKSLENHTFFMC